MRCERAGLPRRCDRGDRRAGVAGVHAEAALLGIVHDRLELCPRLGTPGAGGDLAGRQPGLERRADEAERELVEWKKVKFMIDKVGDEFEAMIISTTRFGFFVELEDLFIEGLVPLDSLPGDRYTYHENVRRIIGERSRRQYSIGDRVRVRLDRVDGVEKKLQFSVAGPQGAVQGRSSNRERKRPTRKPTRRR